MTDILDHADRHECVTCGHEWPNDATPEAVETERVVKDAYGHVLVEGDIVAMIKDLK
jgi:protein PhnA